MAEPTLIVPTDVAGLWDVEFTDGSWHELTTAQVAQTAVVGRCMAICPGCKASRWYGEGPCFQCHTYLLSSAQSGRCSGGRS